MVAVRNVCVVWLVCCVVCLCGCVGVSALCMVSVCMCDGVCIHDHDLVLAHCWYLDIPLHWSWSRGDSSSLRATPNVALRTTDSLEENKGVGGGAGDFKPYLSCRADSPTVGFMLPA